MTPSSRSGLPVLLGAVVLLALAGPVVKWLVEHGSSLGIVPGEAISFCNVLFVGNLCAGLTALLFFGWSPVLRDLRGLEARRLPLVLVNVAFAVAIPTFLFIALERTSVTNVILLGRLESVAFALLAWGITGVRISRHQGLGYGIIVVGIGTLVAISGMGMLGSGELFVIIAAILQGLAAVAGRRLLEEVSVRVFVVVRNAASAAVFFVLAVWLYGFPHFAHAFGPGLWATMAVYGLAVVALGQLAWYRSLRAMPPATVARASLLNPLFAVLFAAALLGERPDAAQVTGGVVIAVGMVVTLLGRRTREDRPGAPLESTLAGS